MVAQGGYQRKMDGPQGETGDEAWRGRLLAPDGTRLINGTSTAQHSTAQHSMARCKILLWGAGSAKGALQLLQWARPPMRWSQRVSMQVPEFDGRSSYSRA